MYIVYSKDDCVMCDKAKQLLTERGVSFTVISIGMEGAVEGQINHEDFIKEFPGIRSIPYIKSPEEGLAFLTYDQLQGHLNKNSKVNF